MPTPDKDLQRVKTMIETAAATVGGQNELARRMGYDKSDVSKWASGAHPCPPKAQAVLADLAGMDAVEVIAVALVQQESNPQRKEALLRALGKRFAHLGVVAFMGLSVAVEVVKSIDTMRRTVKSRARQMRPFGAFFIHAQLASVPRHLREFT